MSLGDLIKSLVTSSIVMNNKNVRHNLSKNFNVVRQGHGSKIGGQQNKGHGKTWLECWRCGKENIERYFP